MFSHVTNCCNIIPKAKRGKRRPACGREELLGCMDTQNKGLRYSILDKIWSKPLWYHQKFESRRLSGELKPQTRSGYGVTFDTTDQFCEYHKKSCDLVFSPSKKNLAESYDFQTNWANLIAGLSAGEQGPCVYPNCWISAAETDKARCDNKFFKLIAHYPSIGRPFQTPDGNRGKGLKNTNISPDSEPGRQVLNYTFDPNSKGGILPKTPRIVQGSHDKSIHQNTAYPGKYWISWWNSIHPGNIIGYEGIDIFKNPFTESSVPLKLSQQIKCNHNGATDTGNCAGITFIEVFQKQAKNKITKLVCGWNHSCILTEDGKCFCWGNNSQGQCTVPSEFTNGKVPVKDLYCGGEYTYVLLYDGKVHGWGANDTGQLNTPDRIKYIPGGNSSGCFVKKLATGGRHVVALMDTDKKTVNGKIKTTYNTLCLWGDSSNNKTVAPRVSKIKFGDRGEPADWQDFLVKQQQYDPITGEPRYPNLDISIGLNTIIPWWPVMKGVSFEYGSINHGYGSGNLAFLDVVNTYESSKNLDDVYNTPISEDIEVIDVWAGRDNTAILTKNTVNVLNKTYDPWYNTYTEAFGGIKVYSPYTGTTFINVAIKGKDRDYLPEVIKYSDLLILDQIWNPTTGTDQEKDQFSRTKYQHVSSITETLTGTNVFVWGKGMQCDQSWASLSPQDPSIPIPTDSNLDYNFYSSPVSPLSSISTTGSTEQTFPALIQGDDKQYQIKTNPSSSHTVILGLKRLSLRPTTSGSSVVACWTAISYNAWGWGENVTNYIWNKDLWPKSNPAIRECIESNCSSVSGQFRCDYFPNMFVIDPKGINFRLNLYKDGPDNFYQFAYKDGYANTNGVCRYALDKDPEDSVNKGCNRSLGGWTFSTELDINETKIEDYANNSIATRNNLLLRTAKDRTFLIERFDDQWTGTPNDYKYIRNCYGNCTENDSRFFSLLGDMDVDLFDGGDEHLVAVQSTKSGLPTNDLNFPYKIKGTQPTDRTSKMVWSQNGYNTPRIINDTNYDDLKNDVYHQAVFDPFTSSRFIFNINLDILKTNTKTGELLDRLNIHKKTNGEYQLVGLRGDQRVKAFTGATCDCMWSDWATDPLKIGGHPGVIINETTLEGHDKTKSTIPWDNYFGSPDRKLRYDQKGIKAINYYNAPPNILTHNLIEIPPGKFPSELSLPCRQKFCEGGVNRTIKNWCDPCFAYQAGITLINKQKAGEVWLGRLGCTGCEVDYNSDLCVGCTFTGNRWICPSTAPSIREVPYYDTPQPEVQINSFGEPSTPLEEAWPSLNRYLIPRWSNIVSYYRFDNSIGEGTIPHDIKTIPDEWVINGSTIEEPLTEIDYPLVIVPSHGGNIGPKYDLEAYQDVALSASLGSIDEYVNSHLHGNSSIGRIDTGVRYLTDFKDTEYPFFRYHNAYSGFTSPNGSEGSTGLTASIYYKPPTGVTFRDVDLKNPQTNKLEPLCGDTEVGCSSCAIPFTGAQTAAWGFDLYAPSVVNAIKDILKLTGDPVWDPEIGNIKSGGVWLGLAKDRTQDFDGVLKTRLRIMLPVDLKEGEVLSFGKGVSYQGTSTTKLNGNETITVSINVSIDQYPNDSFGEGIVPNYAYRWGRFNDECGCSSRMTISPDIFLIDDEHATDTIKKLKKWGGNSLTPEERADAIIGGYKTRGMGLVQYWNCTNTVTYIESGESPILKVNDWFKIGLCDIDNNKPTFLYNSQEYMGDGANISTVPLNTNTFYRGEQGTGLIFDQFNANCRPPTACPQYRLVNSPGIRGIWSSWLSEKGWSNFYTSNQGFDDDKDRVAGDIPFEASHPQGWLGFGSAMPHSRSPHLLNKKTDSSMSISSISDLANRSRNVNWSNSGSMEGIASGIDAAFMADCSARFTRSDTSTSGQPAYDCISGYYNTNNSRLEIYKSIVGYSQNGPEFQNPKTQKLKACCFGDGFEHEVYSAVTEAFIPDTYSKLVKTNKYRNLYNAMWHSHPLNEQYINFRDWHGDPYSPDYCTGIEGGNCKSKYSPVWFDYWWPGVKDSANKGDVGPNGFDVFKNIMHWRHKRWGLPLFIGVNRDNVGNFYVHDPFNCGEQGPEQCSGYELADTARTAIDPNFIKVGWNYREFDSITAQTKIMKNLKTLVFIKSDRGKQDATGRGNPVFYTPQPATFYSMNGSVWDAKLFEICFSNSVDIYSGAFFGLINLFDIFEGAMPGACIRQDSSKWNNYYTHLGPGYVNKNAPMTKAEFTNVDWYK